MMKSMINKRRVMRCCEYVTKIRHAEYGEEHRNNFIKYYYYGLLNQYRSSIKDYLLKRKYRIIDYNGEFGTELKYVIPYAYWHYRNGTLKKTVSAKSTKELYFFSPDHEERYEGRVWKSYFKGIPNSEDHNIKYNLRQWEPVPYKEKFRNNFFVFEKPILIVANKFNKEWDGPPVNYLNTSFLKWLFENYSGKYQIIYNRPGADKIVNDESHILGTEDLSLIRDGYGNVINMDDFYNESKGGHVNNYNHFQLMVYANADRFVSVHGGASVLASYFGGVNVIYSVKGFEHCFDEFCNFYPKLSGAEILHARTDSELMEYIKRRF